MALGLSSGTVRVVPYDPGWPRLFTREADRISGFLGELALALEQLRAEYEALKVALAERYPSDRESYINGKTWFVRNALMGLR